MKIVNFGSLNIDKVYCVKDIVKPGETVTASSFDIFTGGKGLNQSIAVSRAGALCVHAGAVGPDGSFLEDYLSSSGVDTSSIMHVSASTGHAVIQVNRKGNNSIIVFGGANHELTKTYIDEVLLKCNKGDFVLLQNETNEISYIIEKAHEAGMKVIWNPSPFPENIEAYPCSYVDVFMVNEIEASQIAGLDIGVPFDTILDTLAIKFPNACIVMTLGKAGVSCYSEGKKFFHGIYDVDVVDTTAAGDAFCGYFLASICNGKSVEEGLELASAASSIAVSRKGAAPSIPIINEVEAFIRTVK